MAFKRPKKKDKKKIDKDLLKKLIEDLKKRKLGPFRDKTPEMKPMPYRPGKDKEKMKPVPLAKGGFPDLSGDGKVTKKDVLIGRGVIKKKRGGPVDSPKKKKKKKKYDRGHVFKDAKRAGVDLTGFNFKDGGPVDSPKKKKKKTKKGGLLAIGIEIIKPKPISAADGGEVNGLKKMGMKKGGLAGRLAKRGYGKAR